MMSTATINNKTIRPLRAGPDSIAACFHAAAARHSLHRRRGRARKYHVLVTTRGQRATAAAKASAAKSDRDTENSTSERKRERSGRSRRSTAQSGKRPVKKVATPGSGKGKEGVEPMRAPPRRTIRIMPSSTKLGRTDTAKEKAAGEHLKQQKRADDMAEKLKMSVHKARNLLTTTTAKLEEAVRKNMLLRTKEQSEAANRARLRAREWHRIHRKLNHPSKAVTDEEYLSGKHARGSIDKTIYKTLPHDAEKYCVICNQGKFTRQRQSLFQDPNKHVRPGEVWHADVVGPLPTSSKGHRSLITLNEKSNPIKIRSWWTNDFSISFSTKFKAFCRVRKYSVF